MGVVWTEVRLRGTLLPGVNTALLAIVLGVLVVAVFSVERLRLEVGEVSETQDPQATEKISEWKSGGITHRIVTKRGANEEVSDFLERHQEELDAALLIWPKDA